MTHTFTTAIADTKITTQRDEKGLKGFPKFGKKERKRDSVYAWERGEKREERKW